MGSLTPPWADELLSRNTKIARKMMSSMSTESYMLEGSSGHLNLSTSSPSPSPPQRPNRFLSMPVANPSDPISTFSERPNSSSSSSSSPSTSSVPIINGESANAKPSKVVDPPTNASNNKSGGRMASSQSPISSLPTTTSFSSLRNNSGGMPPSSSSSLSSFTSSTKFNQQQQLTRNTEKLSPIRNERDSMFVDNDEESTKKGYEMTNGLGGGSGGGEDLSIIEYGPGIVKKLRSRYQSLALRQYTARPSLRRSASLENVLDAVSAEELAATLESKISNGHHDIPDEATTNGRQTRPRNRFLPQNSSCDSVDSRTGSPAPSLENGQKPVAAAPSSESQQNGKSSGGGTRGRTSGHPDASARRDRMRRARSVDALHRTKREEEILEKFKHVVLPKEEIVIIEVSKPQQNGNVFVDSGSINSNGTGPGGEKRFPTRLLLTANNLRNSAGVLDQQTANRVRNLMISPEHELPPHDIVRETARIFERNQENLNRRIGQALRLSKSASATGLMVGSSPLQSPESPTPTQQQKSVMAQSTTSSSAMQSQDKSFSTAMANGPSSTASSHGQKQIGIIKPTLSNSNGSVIISGNNVNSNKSAGSVSSVNGSGGSVNTTGVVVENNRVRSPILSPIIGFPNKPLLHQNSQKPPLSPKPIFTSSPKVTIHDKPATGKSAALAAAEPSPSTSPILIIENNRDNHRSLSPFKSESPIPRVKSPVPNKTTATSPTGGNNEAHMRSSSPLLSNGKVSPVLADGDGSSKRLGASQTQTANRTKSPEGQEKEVAKVNNKTVTPSILQNGLQQQGSSDHHRQQVTKSDQIPAPPPRSVSPAAPSSTPATPAETTNNSSKQVSQLRTHQKQKSSQKGGNGSMVFNFTSRKEVPDYIEDDGLRRSGGMGSAEESSATSSEKDIVDSRVIPLFEGANIIINGRSSIQKKPKSQKLNISFNENATTTHEYPSESSFAIEEDPSENENHAPKKPSVVTGSSSLGSYTPKTGGTSAYQLGSSYNTITFDGSSAGHNTKKSNSGNKQEEAENDFIEDYLKPNTESTTWSNEMGADIMF